MTRKPKKILFISHEAVLSGAVIVLLELVKWLKENEQVEATVLLKEDGPVKEKFLELGEVYLFELPAPKWDSRLLSFAYRHLIGPARKKWHYDKLLGTLKQRSFDMIYANTIGVGRILDFLKPLNCRVVSHIHELEYVISCIGPENIKGTLEASSLYIAVCEEIKELLVRSYKIEASKILVIPAFVNFKGIEAGKPGSDTRVKMNIAPDGFVAGGAGSMEWRKGVDIFVEVAIQVLAECPDAYFIWIGNPRERDIMTRLRYDIKKAGLESKILLLGPFENPFPYFRMFNLFLLPSREDPYPLVCLENMYLKTPVICFEKSGGANGMIARYRFGKTVPYLDAGRMAEAVINIITRKENFSQSIDTEKLKEEHSVASVAPLIYQAISNL